MDTSIIIMWFNNSEVTVPTKLPTLYVMVMIPYLKQAKYSAMTPPPSP